jgi:AraC-like DNA-binding protein
MSLAQAAYMLGFADQRSFFRACKRWFNVSPGQYRDQLYRPAPGRAF